MGGPPLDLLQKVTQRVRGVGRRNVRIGQLAPKLPEHRLAGPVRGKICIELASVVLATRAGEIPVHQCRELGVAEGFHTETARDVPQRSHLGGT
jgi:hypothetical protein